MENDNDLIGKIVENKKIVLKSYTNGTPLETDLELKLGDVIKLEAPENGGVLVKNLYLSCDPYMRGRMQDFHDSYIPPFTPGFVTPLPFFVLFLFWFLMIDRKIIPPFQNYCSLTKISHFKKNAFITLST